MKKKKPTNRVHYANEKGLLCNYPYEPGTKVSMLFIDLTCKKCKDIFSLQRINLDPKAEISQ